MAGFLVVVVPVLWLGLAGIELAHWLALRQTLSLALVEAARVGVTRQGQPAAIAQAFEHGLRMAYPRPQSLQQALRRRYQALGTPWRIVILQPGPAAFQDHADPSLPGAEPGRPLIRNTEQARQHARLLARGWPQGRGPQSGLNIQQANTLIIELSWPHRPMAPGLDKLVRGLAPWIPDPAQARLMSAGYLPFRRRVSMAMQSDPALWPDLADGRVVHAASTTGTPLPGLSLTPAEPPPEPTDPGAGSGWASGAAPEPPGAVPAADDIGPEANAGDRLPEDGGQEDASGEDGPADAPDASCAPDA